MGFTDTSPLLLSTTQGVTKLRYFHSDHYSSMLLLESDLLISGPRSTAFGLCDIRQVSELLCASVDNMRIDRTALTSSVVGRINKLINVESLQPSLTLSKMPHECQ